MSTMLRYAAMTLLSKTVQTFLYKYLVDIDVDAIAMPSLIDAEGSSGWGVKLSNVRLREGVELMALPGKRHVKKKKAKTKPAKTIKSPENINGTVAVSEAIATENSNKEPEVAHTNGIVEQTARAAWDSDAESIASDFSSGPPTPPAASTAWRCFKTDTPALTVTKSDDGIRTPSFASPTNGLSPSDTVEGEAGYTNVKKKLDFDVNSSVEVPYHPLEEESVDNQKEEEKESDTEQDEKEEEEEEEFIFEQDMTLRLGTGGRIGTLNVRLVGKELYVLVEDAFLVVEAVPTSEDEKDAKDSTGDAKKEDETKTAEAVEKKKAAVSKNGEPQTAADKVMKSSGIARALSAIPRLLLRDCRVRLVVRGEEETKESSISEPNSEIGSQDIIVEIGVELLSVTNGEDFLAHFGSVDESLSSSANLAGGGLASTYGLTRPSSHASLNDTEPNEKNEYLMKRIRTGKGPEGGIWLKIFPPGRSKRNDLTHMFGSDKSSDGASGSQWSLHSWYASQQMCLFRCSGLDLRARIFLGKKKELAQTSDVYAYYGDEYDEYTLDSMLFGADYVVPGPSRAPAPAPDDVLSVDQSHQESVAAETVEDGNGIQRFQMKSAFYRIGQGMKPRPCQGDHLPCEHCLLCWEVEDGTLYEHPLDSAIPMPGVTMHLSLNDPLEINIDRPALEVLGVVKTLFTKTSSSSEPSISAEDEPTEAEIEEKDAENDLPKSDSSKRETVSDNNVGEAFPAYMQPEAIQLTGVHIAELVVRIHVMRGDGRNDCGLSFCYWDVLVRCITADHQQLSAPETSFQDLRFDLGELVLTEYKGTDSMRLVSLGMPFPESDDIDASCHSQQEVPSEKRSAWPSTASVLLTIPTPLETAPYESRERHALQMRYISVADQKAESSDARSLVNVRVGTGNIDNSWEMKSDVSSIIAETKKCLRGGANEKQIQSTPKAPPTPRGETPPKSQASQTSLIIYKIQVDGGSMNPYPSVRVRVPLTSFTGQISSDTGFFLQSFLSKLDFEYGKVPVPSTPDNVLFLSRMAGLPESVRMRILLFLPDMVPLEQALGVKTESNSFLRCRAVNKKMIKLAKKMTKHQFKRSLHKKSRSERKTKSDRRQELLSQIMKLDDASLEELCHTHQKMRRRAKMHARKPSTQSM